MAESNFLASTLSNWIEEIQAPVVLRQTKKYGLLYLNFLFLHVFEDNFQVNALGDLYSAEQCKVAEHNFGSF